MASATVGSDSAATVISRLEPMPPKAEPGSRRSARAVWAIATVYPVGRGITSASPQHEEPQHDHEGGHEIGQIGVERARLDGADARGPRDHAIDDGIVEVALEPRDDMGAVGDGLDEVARLRVKVDRDVLGGTVER